MSYGESTSTFMTDGDGALAARADASAARMPALRQEPRTPEPLVDGVLLPYLKGLWSSQDAPIRSRDRNIERNLRMLAGQHWIQYNPIAGRYFDVSEWMNETERKYRQRPVINLLLPWFLLTHARMTENPPILSWVPGPDEADAMLAEVADVLFKTVWRNAGMTSVIDRLYTWLIPAGRVYWASRVDLNKGAFKPRVARAAVPIVANGQPILDATGQPQTIEMDGVPLGEQWEPLAHFDALSGQLVPLAEPVYDREGQIGVDVLPPMCVRSEWGEHVAHHEKAWHQTVGFFTPEQVYERWGVECEPDVAAVVSENSVIETSLFGHGFFGLEDARMLNQGSASTAKRNLCKVYQHWQRPSMRDPRLRETPTSPGGRYTVFTDTRILVDGTRPVAFPYTSPIRCLDFVNLPGRPSGTSVQDALNTPQTTYNKRRAQLGEHATLTANPKALIDVASGIDETRWTNEPGTAHLVTRRPQVAAVEWLVPPTLGASVGEDADRSREEVEFIGSLKGTGGEPLSPDESGEARKERRYDADRYVGPTQRRAAEEFARMAEDWLALAPVIYDEERVLRDAGEDNVFRSVLVMPELFQQGKVHCVPDLESMLPESRGERQSRMYTLWKDGALGDPADPEVRARFLEQSRFPHLSRVARFGSVDAVTADQENGALILGQPVPVLPFYDHAEHLRIHNRFRKTREFLKLDPFIRSAFDQHCLFHEQALAIQMQEQAMQAMLGMPPGMPGAPMMGGGGGGGGPAPSNVRASAIAGAPPGALPPGGPTPPSDGVPGRLPPRVLGTTAAVPAAS